MENIDLERLLEKYWNAETTVEEEKVLYSFFNNGQYDSKFYQEAKYFKALNASKDVPVRDFDPLAKVKAINTKGQKQEAKVISIFRHWKAVAAAMLLGVASVWVVKATLNNQTVT